MIELNEHAKKAQEIAILRGFKNDIKHDTPAILKHCAGEVVEATEAYNNYLHEDSKTHREELAGELADIITCALIVATNEDIDIEKALQDCQQKNEKRAQL